MGSTRENSGSLQLWFRVRRVSASDETATRVLGTNHESNGLDLVSVDSAPS